MHDSAIVEAKPSESHRLIPLNDPITANGAEAKVNRGIREIR